MSTVYSRMKSCPQASESWFCPSSLPPSVKCDATTSDAYSVQMPYSVAICQDDVGCKFTVCPSWSDDPTSDACQNISVRKGEPVMVYGNCGSEDIVRGLQINHGGPPGPQISAPGPVDNYQCVQDFNLPHSVKLQFRNAAHSYYVCDAEKCKRGNEPEQKFVNECFDSN